MSEQLLSVGLDVGTTTTQLILSRLKVENKASSFAVPELTITDREILYRSPVFFTPLASEQLVNGDAIRELVAGQYTAAGIRREQVDTGAVIITGETSRKENAARVLAALSAFAGDFVVATAGPDLESVLAAKGAGAVALSRQESGKILHLDIGGGTANLALLEDGKLLQTGCMNVGGSRGSIPGSTRWRPLPNFWSKPWKWRQVCGLPPPFWRGCGQRKQGRFGQCLRVSRFSLFPAVWQIVLRSGILPTPLEIWVRCWDNVSGKVPCAGGGS